MENMTVTKHHQHIKWSMQRWQVNLRKREHTTVQLVRSLCFSLLRPTLNCEEIVSEM